MDLLEHGIEKLGIGAESGKIERLRLFIRELELWNRRLRLVGSAGEDLMVRHILDSLAGVPVLKNTEGTSVGDIGSGNGLPGIPLAIWNEEKRFFLVERSGKRCAFLRSAAALCRLKNTEVLQTRLEDLEDTFDLCVFRALGKLGHTAEEVYRAVRKGGVCIGYKGRRTVTEEEAAELRRRGFEADVVPVQVPFLQEERCFILFFRP